MRPCSGATAKQTVRANASRRRCIKRELRGGPRPSRPRCPTEGTRRLADRRAHRSARPATARFPVAMPVVATLARAGLERDPAGAKRGAAWFP